MRQIHVEAIAAAAPAEGENRGRGRGRGGKGAGRGRGRGRASSKKSDAEGPPDLKDVPLTAPKPKANPQKKARVLGATNGTEGPDHFDGKLDTTQPVMPPGQLSDAQIAELMGDSPNQTSGVRDDDDDDVEGAEKKHGDSTVSLGCPRCYFSKGGCSVCRRPGYKPRGPNIRTTGPKAKAKSKAVHKGLLKGQVTAAKAKAKSAAKFPKVPGRGRGRGPAKTRC